MISALLLAGAALLSTGVGAQSPASGEGVDSSHPAQQAFWGSYSGAAGRTFVIARWPDEPSRMAIYASDTRTFEPLQLTSEAACTKNCATQVSFTRRRDGGVAAAIVRRGSRVEAVRDPIAINTMSFSYGGARLEGRLWEPTTAGRHPAVLLIGGTGKNQRDDFRIYPYLFVRAGYVVYAFDTVGDEEGVADLAASNLAAVAAMRTLPEVDPAGVGVLGISHGSWVAVEAAHEDSGVAFIIPVVGGGVPLWRATLFETHAKLVARGHDAADVRAGDALMTEVFDDLRSGRASSVPALIKSAASRSWFVDTPLAPLAKLPNPQIEAIAQARWRSELAYDPAPALSGLSIPVLAISSDRDEAVPGPENLAAISSATKGRAATLLLRNADHFQSVVGASNFIYAAELEAKLTQWLTSRRIASAVPPHQGPRRSGGISRRAAALNRLSRFADRRLLEDGTQDTHLVKGEDRGQWFR